MVEVLVLRVISELIVHTRSRLYSCLKRARRFSGLFAAAFAGEAREVPAIKRDHYSKLEVSSTE